MDVPDRGAQGVASLARAAAVAVAPRKAHWFFASMTPTVHRYEHQAMSTVFELLIATEDQQIAQSAAHAAFQKVDRLEELLSRFLDASEVALISRLKPGETFRVAPELMELLLTATRVCAATRGAPFLLDIFSISAMSECNAETRSKGTGL